MPRKCKCGVALLAGTCLIAMTAAAGAAGKSGPVEGYVAPYEMTPVGDDLYEIKLEQSAIDRLDIQTDEVGTEKKSRTIAVGGKVFEVKSNGDDQKTDFFIAIPERQGENIATRGIKVAANASGGLQEYMATEASDDAALANKPKAYKYYRVTTDNPLLTNGQQVLVEAESHPEQEYSVVPYNSLIYGKNGETWVFTAKTNDTFVRQEINVEFIDGDSVYFLEGPEVSTKVVTIGVMELLGVEYKVGH